MAAVPAQVLEAFQSQAWRLNNLYWITDKDGVRVLFKMNWAQEQLLQELHFLNIILKARQLGFTTFIQIYMLDMAVFYPDTRCGVIAQTRPDAEAIFRDKIKFPYDNLPDRIKGASAIKRSNATELELTNNSLIRVGTSLRGGTLQFLHISEFGKICAKTPDKAREIVTGALNTIQAGQIAFIESTAEGQEGKFYEMCQLAQSKARMGTPLTPLDWKFHFFSWWREPAYEIDPAGVEIEPALVKYFDELEAEIGAQLRPGQCAWYAKKAEVQGADMKREFPSTPKEAFEAAIEGAYYGEQMARAELEGRIGRVPYDSRLPVETWWDLGMNDNMSIWFVQRHMMEVRVIDHYSNNGEGLAHYAAELNKRGYAYGRHIGPHDLEVRELGTGKSRKETAETLGIRPWEVAPKLEILDGIQAVRDLLPRCWFDREKCAEGLKALRSYRKDWDDKLGVWKSYPRHDWASHDADAFRTGAVAPDPRKASSGPLKRNIRGIV
ncbi:terminase [Caulobacter rhizosphaerae]|uniref:terminase n=1 Tax=Caulobacter rhizosphaerae TaxID=2010972 RepID=UPI0013D7CD80|nr:terminase [Caulobacter rhizosphaerae]GGL48373.1 phage terminase large subunit [Caulobacter rhizosphaerae]